MISPVAARVEVVRSVVAVIEREAVTLVICQSQIYMLSRRVETHRNINQCDTGQVIRIRVGRIHESMLAPVTDHQSQAHDGERKDEHERGSAGIDVVVEHINSNVATHFPEGTFGCILELPLSPKVHWELQPNEKDEPAHIGQEVGDAVAVIVHRCTQIVRTVTLDVVVLDVVVKVRIPRMAVHGVQQVWEKHVEQI